MSRRIAILPENITNKIAAGEVVERPASVIKELIENSLDAGATEISIEISAGGRRLIKISDNGHGMSREDALLALERHATSKIRTDGDLENIGTLGFRGEALPSIASVSLFRLASREAKHPEGTEILVDGGRIRDVKACGMAPGTVICVERLFFNTPARQKFMRSAETEVGHVGDTVVRMAISRPDVAISLTSDGRVLLKTQKGDLLRRLMQTQGSEVAKQLFPLDFHGQGIDISGFISGPAIVRSSTATMFTFVNGRFIRDKVVQHAIMQAYRGVIDRGRYPVLALFICTAPGEVDVNVHPTKHEVRFRHQASVHDAIQAALQELLGRSPWLLTSRHITTLATPHPQTDARQIPPAQTNIPLHRLAPANDNPAPTQSHPDPSGAKAMAITVSEPATFFTAASSSGQGKGYFSSLEVIGQFHSEYILCQSGHELVIIDQHAASERVAFQRLKQQHAAGMIESQQMLFPETLDLSYSELAVVSRHHSELAGIGLELEPFGGSTAIISAVPRIIQGQNPASLVRDIIAELSQLGTSTVFQDILEGMLSRIACHSVVRGMRRLERRQIEELLRNMDETDFAASCPHGRPVSHTITIRELEKLFKRT
ncbi:MAG TPA: DNA mismatch repair endonuclease MutL [Deltaproteobacteria bacterium]|nr:DNA mismatch repair endonuclease MutL [Deltaproteobacteria bacterium]